MNERINELREQAFKEVDHLLETEGSDHTVMYREHLDMVNEKFAELIIKECASVSLCIGSGDNETELLKHFGVKE